MNYTRVHWTQQVDIMGNYIMIIGIKSQKSEIIVFFCEVLCVLLASNNVNQILYNNQ